MEDNPWTEARVAELRCLVADQIPYAQIARRLGVSRNAAIGKASLLKIGRSTAEPAEWTSEPCVLHPPGSAEVRRSVCPGSQADEAPPRPPHAFRCEPIPPPVSSAPLNLSIEQLRFFHCRYITNDDLSHATYCARDTAEGTSWCAFHLARIRAPLPADDIPLVPAMAPIKPKI